MYNQTISIPATSFQPHHHTLSISRTLSHSGTATKIQLPIKTANPKRTSPQHCCGHRRHLQKHGIGPSGHHEPTSSDTIDALHHYFQKYFSTQELTHGQIYLATYKSMLKCTTSYEKMRRICDWDQRRRKVLRAVIPSIPVLHAAVVEGIVHRLCVRRRYKEVCRHCWEIEPGYFRVKAAELEAVAMSLKRFFEEGRHFRWGDGYGGPWGTRHMDERRWRMRSRSRVELLRICCSLMRYMEASEG